MFIGFIFIVVGVVVGFVVEVIGVVLKCEFGDCIDDRCCSVVGGFCVCMFKVCFILIGC